jgi:hypothetical protein
LIEAKLLIHQSIPKLDFGDRNMKIRFGTRLTARELGLPTMARRFTLAFAFVGANLFASASFAQAVIASASDIPLDPAMQSPLKIKVDDLGTLEYPTDQGQYVTAQDVVIPDQVVMAAPQQVVRAPVAEPMRFNMPSYGHGMHSRRGCDIIQGCKRTFYTSYEAIWLNRSGDNNFTMSQVQTMPDFGYDLAGRLTFGYMYDCVEGVDFVFSGPFNWTRQASVNGANLDSFFTPVAPFTDAQFDAFQNAASQSQVYTAKLNNYEVNRRWWADNVMSTLLGLRVIDYSEAYSFNSVRAGGGQGIFRNDVDNLMIGAQIGADMYFPVTTCFDFGMRARGGLFGNFQESQTFMSNRGVTRINATDEDIEFSGIIELGALARYRLLRSVVVTGGYEAWFLPGTATVANQGFSQVSTTTGSDVEGGETVIFQGATAGVEISF